MTGRPVPLFCPSCSCTQYATPHEDEALFATKARLRKAMGEGCTRGNTTAKRCPMKERAAPTVPTISDLETA